MAKPLRMYNELNSLCACRLLYLVPNNLISSLLIGLMAKFEVSSLEGSTFSKTLYRLPFPIAVWLCQTCLEMKENQSKINCK